MHIERKDSRILDFKVKKFLTLQSGFLSLLFSIHYSFYAHSLELSESMSTSVIFPHAVSFHSLTNVIMSNLNIWRNHIRKAISVEDIRASQNKHIIIVSDACIV